MAVVYYDCQRWNPFTQNWISVAMYSGDMADTLSKQWFYQTIARSLLGFRVIDHGTFETDWEYEQHDCSGRCWVVYAAYGKKIYLSNSNSSSQSLLGCRLVRSHVL